MNDGRMVYMTNEQAAEIELYIEALMRNGFTDRASRMMNLSLAWRFAPEPEPPLPDNVFELPMHSRRAGA